MPVLPTPHPTLREDPATLSPPPADDAGTNLLSPVDATAIKDLPVDVPPATPDQKPAEKAGKRKLYAMDQALEDEVVKVSGITRVPVQDLRKMVWSWMQAEALLKGVLVLYEEDLERRKKNAG